MPMTMREILDDSFHASAKGEFPAVQDDPSSNTGGWVCCLRTADGRRCGVGRVIPAEKYVPAMELQSTQLEVFFDKFGMTVHDLVAGDEPAERKIVFLSMLRDAHDRGAIESCGNPEQWNHREFVRRLTNLAHAAQVEWTPPALTQ